jgi:hypothetical protein
MDHQKEFESSSYFVPALASSDRVYPTIESLLHARALDLGAEAHHVTGDGRQEAIAPSLEDLSMNVSLEELAIPSSVHSKVMGATGVYMRPRHGSVSSIASTDAAPRPNDHRATPERNELRPFKNLASPLIDADEFAYHEQLLGLQAVAAVPEIADNNVDADVVHGFRNRLQQRAQSLLRQRPAEEPANTTVANVSLRTRELPENGVQTTQLPSATKLRLPKSYPPVETAASDRQSGNIAIDDDEQIAAKTRQLEYEQERLHALIMEPPKSRSASQTRLRVSSTTSAPHYDDALANGNRDTAVPSVAWTVHVPQRWRGQVGGDASSEAPEPPSKPNETPSRARHLIEQARRAPPSATPVHDIASTAMPQTIASVEEQRMATSSTTVKQDAERMSLTSSGDHVIAGATRALEAAAAAATDPNERALLDRVLNKITMLQDEILRYRAEVDKYQRSQDAITRRSAELEEEAKQLSKERAEFRTWRDAEKLRLDKMTAEFEEKLEREKRVAVRQARAAAAASVAPVDKQLRQELEAAKTQVTRLKNDLQAADVRYKAAVERHQGLSSRDSIKITQLEAQVKTYEEERLKFKWNISSSNASNAGVGSAGRDKQQRPKQSAHTLVATLSPATTVAAANVSGGSSANPAFSVSAAAVADGVDRGPATSDALTQGSSYDPSRYQTSPKPGLSERTTHGIVGAASLLGLRSETQQNVVASSEANGHSGSITGTAAPSATTTTATQQVGPGGADRNNVHVQHVDGSEEAAVGSPRNSLSDTLKSHLEHSIKASEVGKGIQAAAVKLLAYKELDAGKIELKFADGTRLVKFKNGTEKEQCANGDVIIRFSNHDVKRTVAAGRVISSPTAAANVSAILTEVYYYHEAGTLHSTYTDRDNHAALAFEVFEFPNGQVELHYSNGSKEILFPTGKVKVFHRSSGNQI